MKPNMPNILEMLTKVLFGIIAPAPTAAIWDHTIAVVNIFPTIGSERGQEAFEGVSGGLRFKRKRIIQSTCNLSSVQSNNGTRMLLFLGLSLPRLRRGSTMCYSPISDVSDHDLAVIAYCRSSKHKRKRLQLK
jgi:hypothetical protein